MSRLPRPEAEDGATLVELLVGMAMGMIVLAGLSMTIIVVLHGNARVDARVEATDSARVTLTRVMEELHSACISPKLAPVRPESSATRLIFWHAAAEQAGAVQPIPVESEIELTEGSLWQTDFAQTGGSSPKWVFEEGEGAGRRTKLLSNVAAPAGGQVFSYYEYEGGNLVPLSASGLTAAEAESTIVVKVALEASPKSTPVADAGAAATVEDSATLRLTPPSYNEVVSALPCQ